MTQWDQETIQKYIDDQVEESLGLDYKSAQALAKTDGKKREITKDVSSMANSDGGIIIYGVAEYQMPEKKHLPERIDPIDQTQFSKEWLEQVINGIRPRIDGLLIHPVPIENPPNHVVYVVEIPQSTTAHQARDYRYYKRFNFESVPMEDYEVRDVMNRVTTPDVEVDFDYTRVEISSHYHRYRLTALIRNQGEQVVEHLKLVFKFPGFVKIPPTDEETDSARRNAGVDVAKDDSGDFLITYRSRDVLFPKDEIDVGKSIDWEYHFDDGVYSLANPWPILADPWPMREKPVLDWILYADNMVPKRGKIPLSELNVY